MGKLKTIYFCLVFFLLFSFAQAICSTDHSLENSILWQSAENGERIISEPPCLNANHEFQYRECVNDVWAQEPQCTYIQFEKPPSCPNDFNNLDNICYKLIPNVTFPPVCPYEDALPFDEYKFFDISDAIWVPAIRNRSDGLGFLNWIEPTVYYKLKFEDPYYVDGTIEGNDCLIYEEYKSKNKTFRLVPCTEQHTGVCAYRKLDDQVDTLCSDTLGSTCKQSDFSPRSKCFCYGGSSDNPTNFQKAEFLEPYQNHVYTLLTADDCSFGLMRSPNGTFLWAVSNIPVNYTYWSKATDFSSGNIYGAQTLQGWMLSPEPLSCFLYQVDLQNGKTPQLHLVFDQETQMILLDVQNLSAIKKVDGYYMLFCFTDASAWSLLYRYPLWKNNTGKFEITPHSHGPGYYWCELFTYFVSIISTPKYFYKDSTKFRTEYVVIVKTRYVAGTDPLSSATIENLERIFSLTLGKDTYNDYHTRIMRIEDIDEAAHSMTVNLHLSDKTLSVPDEEIAFKNLSAKLFADLTEIESFGVEILKILTSDFCIGDTEWPTTKIQSTAFSYEYCFWKNRTRAFRSCVGDFISGAEWDEATQCNVVQRSNQTKYLEDTLKDLNEDSFLSFLANLQNCSAIDVYLLVEILTDPTIDVSLIGKILDKLLTIDDSILKESQILTQATDKILSFLQTTEVNFDIRPEIFMLQPVAVDTVSSLCFIEKSDSLEIWNHTEDFSVDFVLRSSADYAIYWNDTGCTTKVTYFRDNSLFQDSTSSYFRNVFGVPSCLNFSFPLVLLKRASSTSTGFHCLTWKMTDDTSFWINKTFALVDSFARCDLQSGSYYAIEEVPPKGNNVTDDLLDVLSSNRNSTLLELLAISERYPEFNSFDVCLVSLILEKICKNEELDLKAFVSVINNMHHVERSILKISQEENNATDKILQSVDTTLRNHKFNTSLSLISDNFCVFFTDLKESNITGIVLLPFNNTIDFRYLDRNYTPSEILAEYPSLDSALVLSAELRAQFTNDTRMTITFFQDDSLFNEANQEHHFVSSVFGVLLPENENYSGPISVIYNSDKGYEEQCVHWFYSDVAGFWQKDHNAMNLSFLVHCEFWHTTHFALLLLEYDKFTEDFNTLDFITTINCILSLFGTTCIVLTAVLFKPWRANIGNQMLLQFVLSNVLEIAVFYVSSTVHNLLDDELTCTIVGALLHYCVVSQFCWMFIIAVLQFKRFVEVLGGPPKYVLLKACLCGWVLPCLPVACVVVLDDNSYTTGKAGLCYPSGLALYLGIWLPIAIIVSINSVIFLYIIYNVCHKRSECGDVASNEVMFQWRLAFLLFFMLGLTWIFGFLSDLEWGVVFVYLFCFTATLQGFVMFLFFIVFNANTRYLYIKVFKRCCAISRT